MRWIFLLVLLMAACQPAPPPIQGSYNPDPGLVRWDHSPQNVLFRADVLGGTDDFHARNTIPNCTIFGDNHVVWVNELGPFQVQVLEDRLPDETISAFIQHLTVDERIYTYDAKLPTLQATTDVNPVVETVTLNVNDIPHTADSLSGWDSEWFSRVLDACKTLSHAPILVAPSGGWLSAQSVPFSMQPPLTTWDAQGMGMSLSSAADGSPHWISGQAASSLWNTLHSLPENLIFEDGDKYYQVALQVPGITRDSPPAPG